MTRRVSIAAGAAWWALTRRPAGRALLLTPTDEDAQSLADDVQALGRWRAGDPADRTAHARAFPADEADLRAAALSAWATGRTALLIAARAEVRSPLPAPPSFRAAHRTLRLGDRLSREDFLDHLFAAGYARVNAVEKPGEAAVRGEVLDLWAPGWEGPVRALWPFEQIESLRKIDLGTQRSGDAVPEVIVPPATLDPSPPVSPDALPPVGEGVAGTSTLLDYLSSGDALIEMSPDPQDPASWPGTRVVLSSLEGEDAGLLPPPPLGPPDQAGKSLAAFLMDWLARGNRGVLFCQNPGEEERLEEILLAADRGLVPPLEDGRLAFVRGELQRGFLDPAEKTAVLSHAETFGRARRRFRLPKFVGGQALEGLGELGKGDYVVHERFGIGRYAGLSRVEAGGVEADYLRLEYKGGDRVLVPLFEFRQVQKYIGAEGKRPRLSSLDTVAWDKARLKVEKAVSEMARELLEKAARRAGTPGFGFPPDSVMEQEFAGEFVYELTRDQSRAVAEVKADMEAARPMDRLVCGDVGYGKTEVAMRAAMKAVTAGKQVAVLAPTTILAEQHGRNFTERFADFPVKVASLSRFTPPAEEKRVVRALADGTLDVVVGTHRLLSPDVGFKDLGLIVVDEEHRFGVKQKERIQAFRDAVDVLALSATPIPRTLGAALGGLKSLSIIETPPEGRLPIATHVGPWDMKVILAAVENELRRGGQVFYVHNRIGTIQARRTWLEKTLTEHGLAPAVTIAHGQMSGADLEKTMWEFMARKFNILMATSIIESGLDIPSVNTLIVEEAEDFGLAQLYQLRGRVGRERRKAYCFLFHAPEAVLTEEAEKRLSALKEFASLGSGFKLALRDLEIRGAGNLLGREQHGFVNAVGVDLYGRLLAEEISRQRRGEPAGPAAAAARGAPEPALELPVSAFLPEDYLPSEAERIAFYKRLLDTPPGGLPALEEELRDRCGKLPDPARNLFEVARLRHLAKERSVAHIALRDGALEIRLAPGARVKPDAVPRLLQQYGARLRFVPGPPDGMVLEDAGAEGPLSVAERVLLSLGE